jgi:threonine/homoserine/homoserine lactone efflux protein
MTLATTLALFLAMIALAAIPGPGVLAVTARSVGAGLPHGLLAAAGVVAGDYVFITLALLGLVTLANLMGELFVVIKYVGAAYLIWLGISLIRSKSGNTQSSAVTTPKYSASFAAGLITTLGNPKAIVFYISFFPAFLDLATVTIIDALIIFAVATVAIGGVKVTYAYLAYKASTRYSGYAKSSVLRYASGSMLVGSGIYVATRSA